MQYEEQQVSIWKAGELVPAGIYIRIDDASYRKVLLRQAGHLPASFDGHIACYRAAARLTGIQEAQWELPDGVQQTPQEDKRDQDVALSHA